MGTLQEQNWLSVVIPTVNEAPTLGAMLAALAGAPILREVVIADGGSSDGTVAIARAAGALVVAAPCGRGSQLAAGAAAASGPWLLFLHADCRPENGWEEAAGAFAARSRGGLAGYFDFALDDPTAPARRLERLVAWRCRLLALPYGDQGLLIARRLYDAIGGYAPLPLMEDVDLVRRLGRRRVARIGRRAVASARRYRRDGYRSRVLRNLVCLALYFIGVPAGHIRRLYG